MSRQNMMANGSGSVSTIPPSTSAMSSSSVVATETSVSGADQVVFVGATDNTKPIQVERANEYNIEAEMVQNGSEKATYRKLMLSAGIKASFSGTDQVVFGAADDNTKHLLEERGNEHSTEAGMIQIGVEKATIEEFMASEGVQASFSGKKCVVHSGADDSTKTFLGEGENQYINEVEVIQNGAKKAKSEESMVKAVDSVPCLLNSSVMEGGDKVCSRISEENEKSVLGKQLKTMALVILNHTAQFDSAEDCGGSVSVGTLPPSTSAMSSSSIAAAETLPGTDSQAPKEGKVPESVSTLYCDRQQLSNTNIHEVPSSKTLDECSKAEIEHYVYEIQSLQQAPTSALKASLDVVLQDRKKTEENAEKMTSLCVRAPLKSFLAEPIFDNWQEATALGDPMLPTYEDGSICKAQAKIVPTTTSPESSTNTGLKNYIHREGNSPAKLPKKEQKKRVRWPPFLCCLHVPSDGANLVGAH